MDSMARAVRDAEDMSRPPAADKGPTKSGSVATERQVSSGGVVFRRSDTKIDVALICVGEKRRWQLPKGLVDPGESPEITAVREVREEAGVHAQLIAPLDVIEYWYQATRAGKRIRYHKRVHFFLLEYESGDVADHDHEVIEARWFPLDDAEGTLAFSSERGVMKKARELLSRH
jgi:8-oxo-dGTP pyrophosphatase MutT (NUDIX family)